jgi:Protein of unknown function (DUF3727).
MNIYHNVFFTIAILFTTSYIHAFAPSLTGPFNTAAKTRMYFSSSKLYQNTIHKVPEDDDTAIPFLDPKKNSFIECYADSIAIIEGVEYTIGNPCDTSVALCYFDENYNLVPIDLDGPLMDEIFPLAAEIVEEEFGEELVLERTPQTLTLVGELEEVEDDDDYEDENIDNIGDDEEEVEVLLSFEEDGREYVLVKLLDPVLLVGKASVDKNDQKCFLLSEEEADRVMPVLEKMFLEN